MKRKELTMFFERKIKLRPDEAKDFVDVASKCDFDIDIFYNHYVIDAKSILGVMALNFDSVLTIRYRGLNEEFEKYVKGFALAC